MRSVFELNFSFLVPILRLFLTMLICGSKLSPGTMKIVFGSIVDTHIDIEYLKCQFRSSKLVMRSVLELNFSSSVPILRLFSTMLTFGSKLSPGTILGAQ